MRVVIFCHSLVSDWNHGNAHFLRGITSELQARGHEVCVYEPFGGWSIENLRADYGEAPIERFRDAFPTLRSHEYDLKWFDLEEALHGADLVLVHEWNEPELIERIGRHHATNGGYILLFHDTHHRSVTAPHEMERFNLDGYDGVLAFGNSVSEEYRKRGWGRRAWTLHEAADTRIFHPIEGAEPSGDLVWIGNWGDDERTAELDEFLFAPVRELQLNAVVHGVRYPESAKKALAGAGAQYRGWIANYDVPRVFSQFKLTVHVPRRPYATALRGVPTIRVFEALACGIPLISAPWSDCEGLFRAGDDFLFVENGEQMASAICTLLKDEDQRRHIAQKGLETILKRHTCAHRVDELMSICGEIGGRVDRPSFPQVQNCESNADRSWSA